MRDVPNGSFLNQHEPVRHLTPIHSRRSQLSKKTASAALVIIQKDIDSQIAA